MVSREKSINPIKSYTGCELSACLVYILRPPNLLLVFS